MKRFIISALAVTMLAGTALTGTAAMAAPQRHDSYERHDDRRDNRDDYRDDRRDDRRAYRDDRRDDRRDYRDGRRDQRQAYHRYMRGQRLDARYRDNRYYVSDYHRYGLRTPPRGYRWQRVDNDYILAAVATGLIASVIIGNR